MMMTLGLGKAKGLDALRERSDGGAEKMAGVVRHRGQKWPKRKFSRLSMIFQHIGVYRLVILYACVVILFFQNGEQSPSLCIG
jgi:hypothetical protein